MGFNRYIVEYHIKILGNFMSKCFLDVFVIKIKQGLIDMGGLPREWEKRECVAPVNT